MYAAAERGRIPPRLLIAGVVASMLPDIDVIAFALHIPYDSAFGHRGATHSLLFALLVAVIAALLSGRLNSNRWQAAAWMFVCAISHPLMDAMTSGGLGVAIAWPWSDARWFAPWRPIAVSPIGAGFFSARGATVLGSELRWVVLPLALVALPWMAIRKHLAGRR